MPEIQTAFSVDPDIFLERYLFVYFNRCLLSSTWQPVCVLSFRRKEKS